METLEVMLVRLVLNQSTDIIKRGSYESAKPRYARIQRQKNASTTASVRDRSLWVNIRGSDNCHRHERDVYSPPSPLPRPSPGPPLISTLCCISIPWVRARPFTVRHEQYSCSGGQMRSKRGRSYRASSPTGTCFPAGETPPAMCKAYTRQRENYSSRSPLSAPTIRNGL